MSACASERHREPAVAFGQQELTISMVMWCCCALPCCSDSETGLDSTEARSQHSECFQRRSQLSTSWKPELQMPRVFCSPPVPPCSPETVCTESSPSEPFFHLAPPISPFGICSRGTAKSPSWDHSPSEGRILQQVVKDKGDGVCECRSKARSTLPVCMPWAPLCNA